MRNLTGIMLGTAMSLALAGGAVAQERVSVGMIADPGYHAAMWAIMNGKVTHPDVEIDVDLMPIPAAHQAALAQQYDLMPTGVMAVPALAEGGIDVRVLGTVVRYRGGEEVENPGLWVTADSPIQSIEDLVGKSIAVTSVSSGDVVMRRAVLQELYGYDISEIGGDFNWVEIPTAQFDAALEAGRVDAAAYSLVRAYQISQSDDYRVVWRGAADLVRLFDAPPPSVLLISFQDKLDARPEAIATAAQMLRESAEYLRDNADEVFAEVAPEYNADPSDLVGWFSTFSEIPFTLTEADKTSMVSIWELGVRMNILESAPDSPDMFIADQAVTE